MLRLFPYRQFKKIMLYATQRPIFKYATWKTNQPVRTLACTHCDLCSCRGGGSGGKPQITFKPYVEHIYKPFKDHDYKNMALKRPLSPHLEIQAPTLPAMTSITQRIFGAVLSTYALLLTGATLFLPNGVKTYTNFIQGLKLSDTTATIAKFALGFPFAYHYFIGIRFCLWNLGQFIKIKHVYTTAYVALIGSVALAVAFAFL